MVRLLDFDGFVEISTHVRMAQLAQYIKASDEFDLQGLIGLSKYNEFYNTYKISKNVVSITTGTSTILEFSDTADLQGLDYCYLQGFQGENKNEDVLNGKRFKFEILSATQIKLISVIRELTSANIYFEDLDTTDMIITGGKAIEFALFEYFELLKNYMVRASWIRYVQQNKIVSTEAGLVQKNLDLNGFSSFITPQEISLALDRWKTDMQLCKERLLQYLQVPENIIQAKKTKAFVVAKPEYYNYKKPFKRDVR